MTVNSVESLEAVIQKANEAQKLYANYTQEQVDEIFRRTAAACSVHRIDLARMAVEETHMGVLEDKVIKNHFAAEFIYNKYKDTKTCGLIEEDRTFGIRKISAPIGIIAAIIPTTNPTSTAIFKALLALKTRNGIIFAPHPRAKRCTVAAARIIHDAAVQAGAPEGIVGWIDEPSVPMTQHLMKHPNISLILATGGPGMVHAAYSSGKPAIGVGAGNTPAVIDETCHLKMAVSSVLMSKTFDNGVICASEQSIVVVNSRYEDARREFLGRGAYILSESERKLLGEKLIINGELNSAVVGQPAAKIAELAGFSVPEDTKVLIAEVESIGADEPFSYEKLSPILAMYRANDFEDAVQKAVAIINFGGVGHTSVLYTDQSNPERIKYFGDRVRTGRVLINTPASQGAIGDIYNFRLEPSLTLGCGSWGGNSVSENVGVKHLLNVKTVAERRENMLWFRTPPKIYFRTGALAEALRDLGDKKRAFIVTDKPLLDLGMLDPLIALLEDMKLEFDVFYEVEEDPKLSLIKKGVDRMNRFQPDVVLAVGGGSPMDAAKLIWLMSEYPSMEFEGLAMRFMDIRKRIYRFPETGRKSILVAIPTTSGTGSEVTPFAVVTDDQTGIKYPIADYILTPQMAIIDPSFVMNMPKSLTANSGMDAVTHAIEAYASVFANEFTNGLALEALRLLFKYLPSAYKNGAKDPKAREKVHYAATMAGMAFANAFLGVCHSMAHKLGSSFHIPHGTANGMLISQTILFNATDAPRKQASFPQYKYPVIKERFARIADHLKLGGQSTDEKIGNLIKAIEALKQELNFPKSLRDWGIPEQEFRNRLDEMSEQAFDDQCTGGNPRYPLIEEIKEMYLRAYNGQLS